MATGEQTAPKASTPRKPRGAKAIEQSVADPRPGIELVEAWFAHLGWTPWPFQREAWAAYLDGKSGLIQVATGAGKTFAAYKGALAELLDEVQAAGWRPPRALPAAATEKRKNARAKELVSGLRVLYVTPLRAVSRDIELALRQPVTDLGASISVESRTGDTAASVRARQREHLPNVLITTPESLTLLLTRADAQEQLGKLRCVVIDEWHELLTSKRGTQMELALTRLRGMAPAMRTWGVSATLPNLDQAARAAVGVREGTAHTIVQGVMARPTVVDSVLPEDLRRLPWAGHLGLVMLDDVVAALDPAVSTILFTNTRSQAERWFHAIEMRKPEWGPIMALHHGSIDKAERERVEGGVKNGDIRIVVATSSLDLGVDFTPVERVFQIGSPKGIARVAQRAGRSAHRPLATCRITCVPTHALELFEVEAARAALLAGEIEARAPLNKPLDVLAQHMVTCALGGGFTKASLLEEVRGAASYETLTEEEFDWALALVEHGGSTLKAYPDYHRVQNVEGRYAVTKPRIAQMHRLNVGTITGSSTMELRYIGGRSLGSIEESFISQLREGTQFVFAGKTLKYSFSKDLTAYVRPGKGHVTFTPIWGGTKLPISESLSDSFRRTLERAASGDQSTPEMRAGHALIEVQQRLSKVPAHDELLIEESITREGSHLFLFPFEGRLVNAGIAAILALRLGRIRKGTFAISVNDYGLEILSAEQYPFLEMTDAGIFSRENLADDAAESVNISELAKSQFREIARVAGLVFQSYPGAKRSGRQLQAGTGLIFDVLQEFDPGNLLLRQARREVMERHFEQSRLGRTLDRLAGGRLVKVRPERLTPLSFPLLIERQATRLTSETMIERVEKMRKMWSKDAP